MSHRSAALVLALEGKVSSDADRRRAEKVARDAGATAVDDRLVVDPAAGDGGRC